MREKNKNKGLYNQIEKWFCQRTLTIAGSVIFALSLLPVLYLTFVNRASGDDYGYGAYTRAAWMSTHSLPAVCKAMWRTIRQYYYGWQGTWFSVGLFTLQPEVFSDRAYVIVAPLMLALWIGSTFYLFRQIFCRRLGFGKWNYLLITVVFLLINVQFVPSTKSAIFWYNGCAHYMMPFTMCQVTAVWLLQYAEDYKKSTLAGILLLMTLLGGSNYQAALLILIMACYVALGTWLQKKDRRILLLLIPVAAELTGLVISMKAPGNRVRAGEEFGLSPLRAVETIACSFLYGLKDIGTYVQERPLIFVGLFFLFLIFLAVFVTDRNVKEIKYPVWVALMLYCMYSAMQAPAIYAGVEVSRGVLNTNFQVFMLTVTGILLVIAQKTGAKISEKGKADQAGYVKILFPGIFICMILVLAMRSNVKDSTSYVCFAYIVSGQAADYKEQMELQTMLLEEKDVEKVVLPFINDEQGPLMHMPVTADPDAWTNTVTGNFYGKDSVVAMDRTEWMERYGKGDK